MSVGYSTCHWCHVMERESFENDDVAKIMNKHYVNIKVDREERPDVDKMYMLFVQVRCLLILLNTENTSLQYYLISFFRQYQVGEDGQ